MTDKQIRPRLTADEVRYIIHLIELEQEALDNYPRSWLDQDEKLGLMHHRERRICAWLHRKLSRVLKDGRRHAKPGVIGWLSRSWIPDVIQFKNRKQEEVT